MYMYKKWIDIQTSKQGHADDVDHQCELYIYHQEVETLEEQ